MLLRISARHDCEISLCLTASYSSVSLTDEIFIGAEEEKGSPLSIGKLEQWLLRAGTRAGARVNHRRGRPRWRLGRRGSGNGLHGVRGWLRPPWRRRGERGEEKLWERGEEELWERGDEELRLRLPLHGACSC
jgi:hypothetical protein